LAYIITFFALFRPIFYRISAGKPGLLYRRSGIGVEIGVSPEITSQTAEVEILFGENNNNNRTRKEKTISNNSEEVQSQKRECTDSIQEPYCT